MSLLRRVQIRKTRVLARRARVASIALALGATTTIALTAGGASGATGARYYGSPAGHVRAAVVSMAATPSGGGYWVVAADGSVYGYGDAHYYGSMAGRALNRPIVGMAPTRSGHGYWLVATDGGIFSFGDAHFYGSTGAMRLNQPIVGIARTPNGLGYWMVASDGGIFSFGDAHFYGSTGAIRLARPIVGMARTPTGQGYWMVASDGGIFSFGDARFRGSLGGRALAAPIAGMVPAGTGYYLVGSNGTIYAFGLTQHTAAIGAHSTVWGVTAMAAPNGGGFWFVTITGEVYSTTATGQFVPDPNAPASREQQIATDLLNRVNTERRARGLAPLAYDSQLATFGEYWSATMANANRMFHSNLAALFNDPAYSTRYRMLRENIYTGWGSPWSDSGGAHWSLMNSAPHRSTILMPQLTSMGVGVTCMGGHLWVAEEFGLAASYPMPPAPPTPPVQPIAAPSLAGPSC